MPHPDRELIRDLASTLRSVSDTLWFLSKDAGDTPEWNRGGIAYETVVRVNQALEAHKRWVQDHGTRGDIEAHRRWQQDAYNRS